MNQLIAITNGNISGATVQTVNARELLALLEVKKDFTTWMKDQIKRARLIEGNDFLKLTQKGELSATGQTLTEYHLTIEAAKHIGMMSGTDKGFEVRDYFIECEKRALAPAQIDLNDPAFLRAHLLSYTEKVLALESKVEQRDTLIADMTPKAAIADRIQNADGLHGFREVAKILFLNERKFKSWLITNNWIHASGKMMGMGPKVRAGYIEHKEKLVKTKDENEKSVYEMFFTAKGLHRLAQIFNAQPGLDFSFSK